MKIAHINLAKSFRGGEKQTKILIEELNRFGYEQTIFIRIGNYKFKKELDKLNNLKIIELKKPFFINIKKLKDFDLIHGHEAKAYQLSYINYIFNKVPYIITKRVAFKPKKDFFTKAIYKNAKLVVAISKAVKGAILDVYNIRVETIYSSSLIDVDEVKSKELKNKYGNKFIVGHVGELVCENKSQDLIVDVAKELKDIQFIFVGDGKDREFLQNLSKDCDNIEFIGFVENVGDYINIFDIFIFPSKYEGLGSSILDAITLKKCVIATNVGGIPEIIEDNKNGLLINLDRNELKEAILKLYNDRDLREKLANQAYISSKKFQSREMANSYNRFYKEVIGG